MTSSTEGQPLLLRLAAAADPDSSRSPLPSRLDSRTQALVRIGAAVCDGAPGQTFVRLVEVARQAGVSDEEVLGAFLCVAALAGEPRVVAATPRISFALGYDVDHAFEHG